MMNAFSRYLILLLWFQLPLQLYAQWDAGKVCRIEDGKMVLTMDLRWTDHQKKEIISLFELDSLLIKKAYEGQTEILSGGMQWKVKSLGKSLIELSVPLDQKGTIHPTTNKNSKQKVVKKNNYVIMLDDQKAFGNMQPSNESVVYGMNNFSNPSSIQYSDGIARIFLSGYKNANKVYIAGSFNQWDVKKTPMVMTDSGWMVRLKLLPGKYTYKFVIDDRWTVDPGNKTKENDGYGNINSVFYCTNYFFELKGHLNARKVIVAGSFNQWNRNELKLSRTTTGWQLPIFLKEGTHTYKFIVDNEWITDPQNQIMHDDGDGNVNSVISIGDPVVFNLNNYTTAKKVFLTGSFIQWNNHELLMNRTSNGWKLSYVLAPGNYEYKFLVDGQWVTDPQNPYISGSGNKTNSVFVNKPNHTFTLHGFQNAQKVILAGNFNNWNPDGYRMVKKDGNWEFPLYLNSGKTLYKFVVDDQWILDPGNRLWEENEYGTGNSILWIGQ